MGPGLGARVLRLQAALWAVLALSLAGCTQLTERAAGWYVTRKLDSYLDFSAAQKRAARERVDATLERLRRDELPRWISLLREIRHGIHAGLEEPDIERLQRRYDALLDAAVALISPELSVILADLSPAQLDHFAARMREDVEERYEERSLPPEKRQAAIEKRTLKALRGFVGDLSDAQEAAVLEILRNQPDERPAQYEAAHAHITQFRAFMARGPSAAEIDQELRAMWAHRYDALGPGRDQATRRKEQRTALLSVYHLLDAKQRAHAEEKLSDRVRTLKRFVLPS